MSSQAMVQALFGFNRAMNERLWAIIMEHLTDTQFAQTDGYSQGSIRNQIVHMADAQHYWLRGLLNVTDLAGLEAEGYRGGDVVELSRALRAPAPAVE